MSDFQHTQQPLAEATEASTVSPLVQPESRLEDHIAPVEQPRHVVDGNALESHASPAIAAPLEESKLDNAVATPAAEKTIEPITEGQLGYKGPGLIK